MKSKPILPFVVVGLLVRQWMTTIVLALATHSAVAAPPGMIAHQGRIMAGGTGFHGTGQFKFAIVSSTGTQSFWSHDGTSNGGGEPNTFVPLEVVRGIYSVQLGDTSLAGMAYALPAELFSLQDDLRLRVWFNDGVHGFQYLSPALAPMHIAQRSAVGNILLLSGNPTNENPTQLAFGTTAESNGASTIQSIAQAGISYGSLWLNPNGGSVRIGTGAGSFGINTVYANATFNVRRRPGDSVAGRFEDPSGNPKICIDTSDFVLEINGEAYKSNGSPFWNTTSDRRLKSDVRPVDSALETLDRIQPVRFRYTEDHVSHHPGTPETPQYGVVAQEFAEVFPDFVSTNSDGFLGVNPAPLLYFNVAAIRELHSESRKQSSGLDDLRHRQDHLHHRVDEMERLKSENEELRQRLTVLEEAFRRLVGTGNPTPPPDPKR